MILVGFSINYDAIRQRIKEVSEIDAETVYFVKEVGHECPDCMYDPISESSMNPFCPTCHGRGFVVTEEKRPILASVQRVTGIENHYQPGGQLPRGSVIITVHEGQLAQAGYSLDADWLKAIDWIEIDGQKYIIGEGDNVIPQTLQGEVYEVIFHLSRLQQGQ